MFWGKDVDTYVFWSVFGFIVLIKTLVLVSFFWIKGDRLIYGYLFLKKGKKEVERGFKYFSVIFFFVCYFMCVFILFVF